MYSEIPEGRARKDKQNRYVALLIGAIDLSELGYGKSIGYIQFQYR